MPENKNEDIIKIVSNIGNTIGCEIKPEQIMSCNRIAKMNPKGSRPRSIVVQFNSPRLRDTFLAGCIMFNRSNPNEKLNSTHAGFSREKSPVYVTEHLSAANKALHAAARRTAKEKGYKHVWTRKGNVYMRETDTSDYKLIRDFACLEKLD